ncbi:ABC transporter ATP-binding protein [Microvirga makkahensis]|uniref:sn-glycerol-3-phosphate ABC transporter ATP-binding protein UgpC n=1 Tax=Microvirga makkahensis TaxID=1128670 RepID=A0A7X3MSM0_9HYPH|nr:sn-glycerol-3-phosphate ABC transporter ATP-binding protein UgpC [Microvirga makkahensis]MXQ12491.1 sn-glycerol-3-phosphate ABC transporter ATP-binding protein UgpC [Microvirga makkahensis]
MAELHLDNVKKRYGAVEILHGIDLAVEDGEFVVLVGPSGCGKSTLLRMIAGLETVSDGEIRIDGRRANEVPPQKRNISMVFQSYALFPHMTVRENITFGPRIRRESPDATAEKLKRAASILNLGGYLDRRPGQLSGGQRQRVAMGRSIVRNPDLFLFDEPLSNLDAQLRVQMRTEIKALHHKFRSTIIYVTHDQIEAMTMADRIVVMNGGRIEQVGTPLELYDHPANLFVAGFLGSPAMSFLEGTALLSGQEMSVQLPDGSMVPLAGPAAPDGTSVTLGIRPEQYRLDPAGQIRLKVDVIEPTGSESHIYGHVGEAEVRAVFRERISVRPGETLRLSADPNKLHLFDASTGLRLSGV